ncbi:MAG: hypothetical protein ACFFE4_19615 [Candidatus Thorarchaeota archaeon]
MPYSNITAMTKEIQPNDYCWRCENYVHSCSCEIPGVLGKTIPIDFEPTPYVPNCEPVDLSDCDEIEQVYEDDLY